MNDSKNERAWSLLFEEYGIIKAVETDKSFLISSDKINVVRESRLMTKFDHKSQLPKLFSDNNLSILPVSRGNYVIAKFETFHNFDTNEAPITPIFFPNYLESLDYKNVYSEATAINCAFVSNIIGDFTGDEDILPTVSGRMSSSEFTFKIDSENGFLDINVTNSQIEIDGGFEGRNSLCLIEAKNYISKDFIIRQLYYPYQLWRPKIDKKVRPIFLTYTNGIFHLREYAFDDITHYNSLRLVRQRKYAIRESPINIEVIQDLLSATVVVVEPMDIPFPQADSFERVVNLCELLYQKQLLSKEEITANYDFDERQTNYYTDAGRYLGLIDKSKENGQVVFSLSPQGIAIFNISIFERQIEFVKLILSHSAFKETLENYFENLEMPTKVKIVEIMRSSNIYNVRTDSTYWRRASTISGWIKWIMDLIEE